MGESVSVAGAGPVSLAAAWRPRRAGHEVRILEAGTKVGGRIRSTVQDGLVVDRAAEERDGSDLEICAGLKR
jgi:oxygen-dependent protoporphyrinogen oxidase